jgi:hypothetical protein
MAEQYGHVKISRKAFEDDPLWRKRRKLSEWEAWVDFIQMAAWKPYKKLVGATVIELKRGELLASVRFLALRWNWTDKQVRWFLARTIADRVHIVRESEKGHIYLLVNYELYQGQGRAKGEAGASEGHKENTSKASKTITDDVQEVFGHWQLRLGKQRSSLTKEREKIIRARFADGIPKADLLLAIDGVALSDYHRGKYDDLTSIFLNATRVEQHVERALKGGVVDEAALVDDVATLLQAAGDMVFWAEGRKHALADAMERHPACWARAGPILDQINYSLVKSRQNNNRDYKDAIAGEIRRIQNARHAG